MNLRGGIEDYKRSLEGEREEEQMQWGIRIWLFYLK